MNTLAIVFWILLFLVFYTYLGYGILLYAIIKVKRVFKGRRKETGYSDDELPEVTLFISAYNELNEIQRKMENCYALEYPAEKLKFLWVTDGSNDGSPDLLRKYDRVLVQHIPDRNGKIGAMNRGMQFVDTPIIVFSDANTQLSPQAIRIIVNKFHDPKVGCVSGEKRIIQKESDTASGAGEGIYWKYESLLKKWDAELYSVVGAAGELFAIRTSLYQHVERDTLLDDFIISLRIAQNGQTIAYDPDAYAIESASMNIREELKRKVRISAGGIQSVIRLSSLLNIFRYGWLSFQYISHRVLRWTLTPLALLLLLPINGILAYAEMKEAPGLYSLLFVLQLAFYALALLGWQLENRSIRIKILFIPFYFLMMNVAVFMGLNRYFKKQQSVNWERAQRAMV